VSRGLLICAEPDIAHLRCPSPLPIRYSVFAVPLLEKALIVQIRRMTQGLTRQRKPRGKAQPTSVSLRSRSAILTGIGDDCAVLRLPAGYDSLVTTDFSLEGIHFRRDWHPSDSVGHRCLARGLSDIAAMGGDPVAAFLSLALPRDLPQSWVNGFVRGLLRLAEQHGVALAGGDTSESPAGVLADIIVLGTVPKGKAVLRSGARPGDLIYVSGELGGSAAALALMMESGETATTEVAARRKELARKFRRHFYPEPRIELARRLREQGLVTAMIDTSDGLSTDLAHLCHESGVGAEIDSALVPRARVGRDKTVDLDLALHGGEDYELLFAAPVARRIPARLAGVSLTRIGQIARGSRVLLRDGRGRLSKFIPHGWEHFRKQSEEENQEE
jgi:thiamine-monophosphate kinase